MKTKRICINNNAKVNGKKRKKINKHYTNKQQQTTLSKQALYTALYIRAIK